MSEPDRTHATTAGSGPTDPPTIRLSKWTCQLPKELLFKILEMLVKDKAFRSIANVQSTSSTMYTLTTPFLYRHVELKAQSASRLFGQFADFPRSENKLFCNALPSDQHLIDLHKCYRLRSFFSHTRLLSFTLANSPEMRVQDHGRIKRYKDLTTGLAAFEGLDLWPNLLKCDINLNLHTIADTQVDHASLVSKSAELYGPILEAVFSNVHPKMMSLVLPGVPSFDLLVGKVTQRIMSWAPWIRHFHADYITLPNIPLSFPSGLPTASHTLKIECDSPLGGRARESVKVDILLMVFVSALPLIELDNLVITGTFHSDPRTQRTLTPLEVFRNIKGIIIDRVVRARVEAGNPRGLKLAIKSAPGCKDPILCFTFAPDQLLGLLGKSPAFIG